MTEILHQLRIVITTSLATEQRYIHQRLSKAVHTKEQEDLAVASIARDVVV